jgi:hypothetical protein
MSEQDERRLPRRIHAILIPLLILSVHSDMRLPEKSTPANISW